ncbi:MAG: roadblock/LC7 domain-containing protein [Candidatus Thorarchaeota archaeon]
MDGKPELNKNNNVELSILLDELKVKGKFEGVVFAKRNGEVIESNVENNSEYKKLTSMCASVLESAVGLGETMGDQKIIKIIAELEKTSILMVEIKEKKVFFIFIINDDSDSNFIFEHLEEHVKKICSVV